MSEPAAATTHEVTINGERRKVPAQSTLASLLAHLGLDPKQVAVERNRQLVRRAQFAEVAVQAGDELEIVTFFGGG
jgi:thiamine biosynthesis protein ThiS